jgi:hypothetical protein
LYFSLSQLIKNIIGGTMKRLIAVIAALFMVVGFASMAMAAQQVEVKTNSEGVTGAVGACEKAGNITFIFDAGTVIRDGDWFTADLPLGVTLCASFDFVVTGNGAPAPGGGGFNGVIPAPGDGLTLENKIWAINDLGALAGAQNVTVAGTPMFFRVRGNAGANRLRIDVYDSDDVATGNGVLSAVNYDGTSTFTVGSDTSFQLKLFDGFDGNAVAGRYGWNNRPDSASGLTNGTYGDNTNPANDWLQAFNDTDNSYCINVDTDVYLGSTVNVSINSGGFSGNNFLTFNPSNPQVAHLISATSITLEACKGELWDYVPFEGGQSATCAFTYNTGLNYCNTDGWVGNEFILQNNTGTFYNNGDNYRMRLIISGSGAYWGGAGGNIDGYEPDQDPCDGGLSTNVSTGWTETTEGGAAWTGYRSSACGTFDAGEEVTVLTANVFTGIQDFNRLVVAIPPVVYDRDQFVAGDEVTATIELWRLPCGLIFTAERKIAEFVDTCAAAVPNTTLYYPFTVALDGSQGFWFGFSIGNPSALAGTADIMFYEADGDAGTFTTPSIAAGGILVYGGADLLSNLTPDAANPGTLGDTYGHIVVITNFGSAGGFGMTGNGDDSTGYTAYGRSGSSVGVWTY